MTQLKVDWQPEGVFALNDSDNHVGSLLSIEDLMEILSVKDNCKEDFIKKLRRSHKKWSGDYIKEPLLQEGKELWKQLKNEFSDVPVKQNQSLSELELISVIKRTFGESNVKIEEQFKEGKYSIDICAAYKGKDVFIDFLGPRHFEDEKLEKDNMRKQILKDIYGKSIIEWPYWIQMCERNVRIAFGEHIEGKGAIWGSKNVWGGVSENISKRIISLSKAFNSIHEDGIGYFYEEWKDREENLIKPAHPIIKKIMNDEYQIDVLIPQGVCGEDRKFWLPKELWYKL